jgi:hypothetical protein
MTVDASSGIFDSFAPSSTSDSSMSLCVNKKYQIYRYSRQDCGGHRRFCIVKARRSFTRMMQSMDSTGEGGHNHNLAPKANPSAQHFREAENPLSQGHASSGAVRQNDNTIGAKAIAYETPIRSPAAKTVKVASNEDQTQPLPLHTLESNVPYPSPSLKRDYELPNTWHSQKTKIRVACVGAGASGKSERLF